MSVDGSSDRAFLEAILYFGRPDEAVLRTVNALVLSSDDLCHL